MSADGTDKTTGGLYLTLGRSEVEAALTLASDVVLVLAPNGVIESARGGAGLSIPQNQSSDWVGRNIRDTLTEESISKINARLFDAKTAVIEAMELNHIDRQNRDYPIRYACSRLSDGKVLMLGRDLNAIAEIQQDLTAMQLELERERQGQRQFETKYRLLMQSVRDPIMLVDAETGHIVDVNDAFTDHLGERKELLKGKRLQQVFDLAGNGSEDALSALRTSSASAPVELIKKGGKIRLMATGAVHRVINDQLLLCRMINEGAADGAHRDVATAMTEFYAHGDEAIAITRADGGLITTNECFLRLANISNRGQLKDQKLDQYLARGMVDLKIILKTLDANRSIKRYQTSLRDEFGAEARIEISATKVDIEDSTCIVFILRDGGGSAPAPRTSDYLTEDATRSIAELIGGVDLKNIVADTTEVVERMCIDIALDMTNNNRVATANMLGLSRQSLYVKIRKYGL